MAPRERIRSGGHGRAGERGQTLVLVVIFLTVVLGLTAVAIDGGRFFSERRFLQNAADAAALAGATALTQGATTAEAEAVARSVLGENLDTEPTGRTPSMPSTLPVYEAGHVGEPAFLVEGILVDDGEVRVAVRNKVDYTFGRVVGLTDQEISARARAGYSGGLLPIAVRQFLQPPGPESGAATPCAHDEERFMAVFATADTACLGSETVATGRVDAGVGDPFDPSDVAGDPGDHGPIVAILGSGATPINASDFRGFIALDIRNFATETSQRYFNGVTSATNENAVKDIETGWILAPGGYPGPGFPTVTSPPDPNHQVAILSGNSAGLAIDAMRDRFTLGDEILVTVYPGYVMAVPDFAITGLTQISLPETGEVDMAGSFRVSRNQAFTGTVDLSTVADTLDADNPLLLGTVLTDDGDAIDYDPDPVAPALGGGTRIEMTDVETIAATPGIYAVWVMGQAGLPYLTAKREPLSVKVGTVTRDFAVTADATGKVAASSGDAVSFSLLVTNAPNRNTAFGGPVTLSVDAPLPSGTGAVSFSSTSVTPSRAGGASTLTIQTGSLPQGSYRFVVRATGMNADATPRKVTHLLPLTVNVAPDGTPGNDEYLDITGFAVMRIARMDSNTVEAYAITPVIADLNDPRLRRGQTARLSPW